MSDFRLPLKGNKLFNPADNALRATCGVLLRNWDTADRTDHYCEVWQFHGFPDANTWLKYDNFTKRLSLLKLARFSEEINPHNLTIGDNLSLHTPEGASYEARVTAVATGTVKRAIGKPPTDITFGDAVSYAQLYCTIDGRPEPYWAIKYEGHAPEIYQETPLTLQDQVKIFGEELTTQLRPPVTPTRTRTQNKSESYSNHHQKDDKYTGMQIFIFTLIVVAFIFLVVIDDYDDDNDYYYYYNNNNQRSVYGGGGGVGK